MLFRLSPATFWNLIAKKYASSPIQDKVAYEKKLQKIKTYLSAENVVLDIGCGTGTQCGDIASNVKHVTGIDISRKLLTIARQRIAERNLDNVEFIQASLLDEQLDKSVKPGSIDVIMGFFVLHFFDDINVAIKRIHALLKPGGMFISETACIGEKGKMLGIVLRFLGFFGLLPKINILKTRQVEQALEKNGFEILDKTKYSCAADAELTLVARKTEK